MRARQSVASIRAALAGVVMLTVSAGAVQPAAAGPVVREAAGATAAAVQAAVDAFRNDVGNPNNGNAAGSQVGGRREINWDGGGAAAPIGTFPIPMTTFSNRGSVFFTPGSGFEISGQPSPEFADLNPTYPALFAAFSSPRLFTALGSNVMDAVFTVPGTTNVPAATAGFGVVFTDVDSSSGTKMEFYAPDGQLLFERVVLPGTTNESFSFLGVSFNAGELIGRVRIISGNAAPGPNETGALDVVMMDDFFYAEPVSTSGLTVTPESGRVFRTAGFDLVVGLQGAAAPVASGRVALDGLDVTSSFLACLQPGTIVGGGQTFRCTFPRGILTPGDHTLQVELTLAGGARLRNAVRWTVVANTEP